MKETTVLKKPTNHQIMRFNFECDQCSKKPSKDEIIPKVSKCSHVLCQESAQKNLSGNTTFLAERIKPLETQTFKKQSDKENSNNWKYNIEKAKDLVRKSPENNKEFIKNLINLADILEMENNYRVLFFCEIAEEIFNTFPKHSIEIIEETLSYIKDFPEKDNYTSYTFINILSKISETMTNISYGNAEKLIIQALNILNEEVSNKAHKGQLLTEIIKVVYKINRPDANHFLFSILASM